MIPAAAQHLNKNKKYISNIKLMTIKMQKINTFSLSSIAAVSSLLSGQCSSIGGQLCEYHFIGYQKTWKAAQEYCSENHTDLATVSNQTDMQRLLNSTTEQYPDGAWIGLQNNTPNTVWRWSQPGVEFNGLRNCVRMNDGTWDDDSCSTKSNFICYDGENMWRIESVFP
uniref:C-type lectin domain-containing protein n=1 Tax=Sander lucioperca TaxID=283035 RepID=A0A8C9ZFI2_SANLU